MFRDAALFRRRGAPHAKRWAKVATGLIHEVDLAVAGKRLCLASSDGDAFEVICLSKTEVPTRVAKGPYMPWAFTATPTGLTWFESKVLHNEARGMVALDL